VRYANIILEEGKKLFLDEEGIEMDEYGRVKEISQIDSQKLPLEFRRIFRDDEPPLGTCH
jgi:hypothetical protein